MDHQLLMIVLRLIHIIGGVLWVGAAVVMARFIFPAIRAAGPGGGQVMRELVMVQKFPVFMSIMPPLTVLSGIWMYGKLSAVPGSTFMHSHMGITLAIGGVLAIVAVIIGVTQAKPASEHLGALSAEIAASGTPPTAEQRVAVNMLQNKLGKAIRTVAVLLILTTVAMAVARYV